MWQKEEEGYLLLWWLQQQGHDQIVEGSLCLVSRLQLALQGPVQVRMQAGQGSLGHSRAKQ